jgi:H+/Cl- antiporter ClcA
MLAFGGTFTAATSDSSGYDFVPRTDGFFWTMVGLCVLGCVAAVAGLLVQLVEWVGALVNTNKLVDKGWFVLLLVTGLLGLTCALAPLGFAGMVAYLIAGPDGTVFEQPQTPASQAPRQPTTLAPTSR